jgi:hypothetical protein
MLKNAIMADLEHYPSIFLEELRKTWTTLVRIQTWVLLKEKQKCYYM